MEMISGKPITIISQLFRLSDDTIALIVSNWLDIRAIGALDNAITDREQRRQWLRCLSKVDRSVALNDQIYTSTSFRWLINKRFRTSKLILNCEDRIRYRIFGCFPSLTEIDVRGSKFISDENVSDIVKMSKGLKFLYVSGCKYIHDISYIAEYCRGLIVFEAEGTNVGNWGIGSIAKNVHDLEVLKLKGACMQDKGAAELASGNPKLTCIDLSDCTDIADFTLLALANSCPNLSYVGLGHCHNITDVGIIALVGKCSLLQTIDIQYCCNITDRALIAIAEKCRRLLHLNLRNLNNITNTSMSAIALNCPQLLSIDLVFCNEVTSLSLIALTQGCPELVIQRKRVTA
jgi:Leucine Rich repeat